MDPQAAKNHLAHRPLRLQLYPFPADSRRLPSPAPLRRRKSLYLQQLLDPSSMACREFLFLAERSDLGDDSDPSICT
jgi:hypothetical protein